MGLINFFQNFFWLLICIILNKFYFYGVIYSIHQKTLKMKKEFQPQYKIVRINLQTSKKETLSLHYSFKDAKLSFDYWANYVCNRVNYLTWKGNKLWDTGNNCSAMFYRNTMFQYDIYRYEITKRN